MKIEITSQAWLGEGNVPTGDEIPEVSFHGCLA